MRIIIAPDSFKESIDARTAAEAIARGVRRANPHAEIDLIPMADGGEGTVDALVAAGGGEIRRTRVTGPLHEPVEANWGLITAPDGAVTAVLEMAAASGLALVPPDRRNPLVTTTFGTGELMRAALDAGAKRLLVGIGGSATTDGGAGAAQAVGVRFLDGDDAPLPEGIAGGDLDRVARIDMAKRDPRIGAVAITVASDVDNPLCGPRGAAAIYGPQKGATPAQVAVLDRHLAHLATLIRRDLGCAVEGIAGAGAAGGLGAGLVAFFNATLSPGVRLVMDAVGFEQRIAGADLILTGEGRLDAQSLMGKVIAGVGHAGRAAGVPVIALAGAAGDGAKDTLSLLHGYHIITPPGMARAEAMSRAAGLLESAAAAAMMAFSRA